MGDGGVIFFIEDLRFFALNPLLVLMFLQFILFLAENVQLEVGLSYSLKLKYFDWYSSYSSVHRKL